MAGRANIEGRAGAVLYRSRDNGEETRMEKTNLLTVWGVVAEGEAV